MIFNLLEAFDVIIMCCAIGYIFMDMFKRAPANYDPLAVKTFDTHAFMSAVIATAPAIILHELGHKIVALILGYAATFHAHYVWLGIGVLLKAFGSPLLFFVPAYVSISGDINALQQMLISGAGPLMNLILFLVSWGTLKLKLVSHKYVPLVAYSQKINLFLFAFNLIPIPGFDGWQFFSGLWDLIF